MLGESKAFSGFAVDDLPKAKAFYEDVLGLKTSEEHGPDDAPPGGRPADARLPRSPGHEPASYTILNFPVAGHRRRGRRTWWSAASPFELYEGSGQDEKGVMRRDGPPITLVPGSRRQHPVHIAARLTPYPPGQHTIREGEPLCIEDCSRCSPQPRSRPQCRRRHRPPTPASRRSTRR